MSWKFRARVVVRSEELSISEISEILGISCDDAKVKGTELTSKLEYKDNIWILRSQIKQDKELSIHIRNLEKRLKKHEQNFKKGIDGKASVYCSCCIEGESRPPLYLEPENIIFLSRINAALDIDQYVF
ncbi:MAG: DUF4279 domain-containing protein [Candidatus Margulisbacteria bacterium]|nr:DUF4279 domain-containing protein [Candidatus Margulisiibacteriota bacterium]